MSGIQLAPELIENLKNVVTKHDAAADNDFLFMQYLSAVTGFVLAHQTNIDKREFLTDINTFTQQVLEQVEADQGAKPAQEDAFGVWKPE